MDKLIIETVAGEVIAEMTQVDSAPNISIP